MKTSEAIEAVNSVLAMLKSLPPDAEVEVFFAGGRLAVRALNDADTDLTLQMIAQHEASADLAHLFDTDFAGE